MDSAPLTSIGCSGASSAGSVDPHLATTELQGSRGGGPTAMPHGEAPTRIVATTFRDAVSMTETSFDDPLAVYKNLPSDVSPTPQGRAPTRTSATTVEACRSTMETVRALPFAT